MYLEYEISQFSDGKCLRCASRFSSPQNTCPSPSQLSTGQQCGHARDSLRSACCEPRGHARRVTTRSAAATRVSVSAVCLFVCSGALGSVSDAETARVPIEYSTAVPYLDDAERRRRDGIGEITAGRRDGADDRDLMRKGTV
jgi:hypothetical protein